MAILAIFISVLEAFKVGVAVCQTLQQPTFLLIILTRSDDGARASAKHLIASP